MVVRSRRRVAVCALLALWLAFATLFVLEPLQAQTGAAIPRVWDIVTDDFEGGTLDAWQKVTANDLSLVHGGGHNLSTGLSVAVSQGESYVYLDDVARAEEGYLTFWFNPIGLSIDDGGSSWPPEKSIRIANVKGSEWWHLLVGLRVRPEGQGFRAYLEWRAPDGSRFDFEAGEFDLVDGWQQIVLGYHVDEWVAVWLNGTQVRRVSGVEHEESWGEIIELGKTSINSIAMPSGEMRYDRVAFQIPRLDDLWVDAASGEDANEGLTPATAFRSIQKAADLAGPGTVIHIMPGVYRETVWPAVSGSAEEPVKYVAEQGAGTVVIRGSEPASSFIWTRLEENAIGLPHGVDPADIYFADLTAWGLDHAPRFVVAQEDGGDTAVRLPAAREPDWEVATEWKHHEFWWAADGGSEVAECVPATDADPDCDLPSRSLDSLTDRTDDAEPAGVEPGNLTTLGNLTGATLVAMDTRQGHYVYRRTIVGHDVLAGQVMVSDICEYGKGSSEPGLGWGSKYYVEGRPFLLDNPGEWWYDGDSGRIYLWPLTQGNPSAKDIEISVRDVGFNLSRRSRTVIDGLNLEFFNGSAVYQSNGRTDRSSGNHVRNIRVQFANHGVWVGHWLRADSPPESITDGFTLEGSEIAHIDSRGLSVGQWWENNSDPNSFRHSAVVNTVIRGNEFHHLGFRSDSDNGVGVAFPTADRLRFEGNHVHHVAQNGVQLLKSVILSSKDYGFDPGEIQTGQILIKDNTIEKACQLTADCGALKIWGDAPDGHVFRDLLVTGNVFRNTFGWTYAAEKRGRWRGGSASNVRGMGGFGLYVDMASGIHAYRNIAYNNSYAGYMFAGVWRDGDLYYYNNLAADSLMGFRLAGSRFDTHGGSINTQLVGNIIVNNEGYGIVQDDDDGNHGNLTLDHNLYYDNGWRLDESGGLTKPGAMAIHRDGTPSEFYQTLAEIQAGTAWEDHGLAGDPRFWHYDPGDRDPHDGSWPDFHPTAGSGLVIDRAVAVLPESLQGLLDAFGVLDPSWGPAFDVGRYEAGFALLAEPQSRAVAPGGMATYALRLHPPDLPFSVNLAVACPSPHLTCSITPKVIGAGSSAALTISDTHQGPEIIPGLLYDVTVSGVGEGFTRSSLVRLLVGGVRVHIPLVHR